MQEDIIVVLIVLFLIVVVLINAYLPDLQFKKAKKLYGTKKYMQAIYILNKIFRKHDEAPVYLAECYLSLGELANSNAKKLRFFTEVIDIRARIENYRSINSYTVIEAKAFLGIAEVQFASAQGSIAKLNLNISYIDKVNQKGVVKKFEELKSKHYYELAEIYFHEASNKERVRQFEEAIEIYTSAKEYGSFNATVNKNSIARIAICQLKANNTFNKGCLPDINESNTDIKNEFYYRYAISLLKNKEYDKAEQVINSELKNQSDAVNKLRDIVQAEKYNFAIRAVEDINNKIKKLYSNSLSEEELKIFYESLDETIRIIDGVDNVLAGRISSIKPTLFSRLLSFYILAEQFANSIKIISKYPRFWENIELLKNLGICCYGFTANGLLNERNYRIVISSWLTVVFCDSVILNSLKDTFWDDNHTFSLVEAIGSNYSQHHDIPDNVNYDEVSESNISIGATQRELLQQYEKIIQKEISDATLAKSVIEFYDHEKKSIEHIVQIIEEDIFFTTPFFSKTFGINTRITETLDRDYLTYSDENSLEAGIPYLNPNSDSIVSKYSRAKELIIAFVNEIKMDNVEGVKTLNTTQNRSLISKFKKVITFAEDSLYNAIAEKINEDNNDETLFIIMDECIRFTPINEKLKYQYSNYIANYCISKVNEKDITHYEALALMKKAFERSPKNPRICKNLVTLIRFNLLDILNENTNKTKDIYKILDWVSDNMSDTLRSNGEELGETRKMLLEQLEQNGVDISLFHESYHNRNIPLSILQMQTLNDKGLIMKKVLHYFKILGNVPDLPLSEIHEIFERFHNR